MEEQTYDIDLEDENLKDKMNGYSMRSIAISLKRIADVLDDSLKTGHADGRSLHDIISSIEMNGR